MKKFTKVYNSFFGASIESPEQIEKIELDGKELERFCNFYYKESAIFNFDEYEIQTRKLDLRVTRLLWLTLGFILACLLILSTLYYNVNHLKNL